MIDAFRIGVTLGFRTSGATQLTALARHLNTLNRLSREVNATLERVAKTAQQAFSLRGAEKGAQGLRGIQSAAKGANRELNSTRVLAVELSREMTRLREEAKKDGGPIPLLPPVPGQPRPRRPGGGGGGGGAIPLTPPGGRRGGRGGGAGGGGDDGGDGGGGGDNGAAYAGAGLVAMWAGRDALRNVWDIVRASEELNRELNRTAMLGGDFAATLSQQRALAFSMNSTVPTSTPAENVRMMRELGTQLGSPVAAMGVAPIAAQFAWDLEQFTGKPSEDGMKNAVRAIVDRGAVFSTGADGKEHVDPAKFTSEMNAVYRAIVLSGGLLTPQNLLQLVRQAGPSARLMDQQTFYTQMIEAAVAMGASRAGTASMSMFQQLAGGTMTRRTVEEMERVGLIKSDEWRAAKGGGGHIVVTPDATRRLAALAADPLQMVEQTLMPKFKQMGMSSQDMLVEVFRLFGRQTTQRLVADLMNNQPQFARLRGMFGNTAGVENAYGKLQQGDISTNVQGLSAAWQGLMDALGSASAPAAISVLKDLTAAVHGLTKLANDHPHAARDLMAIGAALGVLLVAGGTAAVVRFSFGSLATSLGGLSEVLGAFASGRAAAGLTTLTAEATGLPALAEAVGLLAAPEILGAVAAITALGIAIDALHDKNPSYDASKAVGQGLPHAARPGVPVLPFMQPHHVVPTSPFPGGTSVAPSIHQQSYITPQNNGPMHVIVINAADIGRAAAGGTISRIGDAAFRPPTGPTAGDLRTTSSYPSRMAQS